MKRVYIDKSIINDERKEKLESLIRDIISKDFNLSPENVNSEEVKLLEDFGIELSFESYKREQIFIYGTYDKGIASIGIEISKLQCAHIFDEVTKKTLIQYLVDFKNKKVFVEELTLNLKDEVTFELFRGNKGLRIDFYPNSINPEGTNFYYDLGETAEPEDQNLLECFIRFSEAV
ncbi:MAG: hypothetical protein N4A44_01770 [Alphaproteobacteria bacterium]|jgi:ribosomal protein L25 (general stress protein Ctc)|nr:hypothetical protein [Alphaproteobacteria bacterium]